jgi:uncharacterized lipoprotein YehR (DUF1307 family)
VVGRELKTEIFMNERSAQIRTKYLLILLAAMIVISLTSCDESEMAVNKTASPVLLDIKNTGPNEVTAYFYEWDKIGIPD